MATGATHDAATKAWLLPPQTTGTKPRSCRELLLQHRGEAIDHSGLIGVGA